MPSSNKTQHYRLNRWIGSDKPKKDDFNDDNLILDAALASLRGEIGQSAAGVEGQIAALGETVSQNQQTMASNLSAHAQDAVRHITAQERQLWNSGAFYSGTYTGNNETERKITLGYKPKLGILFAVDTFPVDYSSTSQYMHYYFAIFSEKGCTGGLTLENDGFTVRHQVNTTPTGFAQKYNASGKTYVYFVWK